MDKSDNAVHERRRLTPHIRIYINSSCLKVLTSGNLAENLFLLTLGLVNLEIAFKKIVFPMVLGDMKVLLFLAWSFTCCKIGWDSVMRMNADLRDLFLYEALLYYNPLLLVTMMVWLWGVCLLVFSQSTVNYARIFDLDQNHLTRREIWQCSVWMKIIVPTSMTAYLYLFSYGEVSLGASQPV
ncbi:SPX and EXS domain-containing protein 1-like isoform X2 [Hibiscus syriacus]|uniref:SPX and EXS domain-containing protein 1-like isoform X2 n=1 Tax=Hibiscus syriacus TaxID=106335 RepID=A0A6A2WPT3_HIBSY|nr:SPX and EXS domain-containing protein 1-like isoform X2 [Hibiscus syriacus]